MTPWSMEALHNTNTGRLSSLLTVFSRTAGAPFEPGDELDLRSLQAISMSSFENLNFWRSGLPWYTYFREIISSKTYWFVIELKIGLIIAIIALVE